MQIHDIALVLIAFISEVIGTISGFGSSTFFVPMASLLESFKFVLALTAILHCFGNVFKISAFKENFEWKYFLPLVVPSIVFTAIGAILTSQFTTNLLEKFLGVFLIVFSLIQFSGKLRLGGLSQLSGFVLSSISGFLTGFVGTGGVIRGVALSALGVSKNSFVVLSATIDLGGDLIRAILYLINGYMDWRQWFYLPLFAVAAFFGVRLGKKIIYRINQVQFERLVSLFILLSGITMLVGKS